MANLGVYIHLPYCLTKCPYCDFNSYGVGINFPENEYVSTLLKEIDLSSELLSGRIVDSIFFGGGTPSLFSPDNIYKIINKISTIAKLSTHSEITLEINPKTSDLTKLKHFYDSGINRASIGIQSFSERKLEFYKRLNTPREGEEALEDVSEAGFKNFNIDIIYGSSEETIEELENDLKKSMHYHPTHISAYCLTIEDGTEFGNLYKQGKLKLPEDSFLSEMYQKVSDILSASGFEHYEISNFSKPGYECSHNLKYWKSQDYLGFGAGAHSHIISSDNPWGLRWANIRTPSTYIKSLGEDVLPIASKEVLSLEKSLEDKLLMGLRLSRGVNIKKLCEKYGMQFNYRKIEYLIEDKFIDLKGDTVID